SPAACVARCWAPSSYFPNTDNACDQPLPIPFLGTDRVSPSRPRCGFLNHHDSRLAIRRKARPTKPDPLNAHITLAAPDTSSSTRWPEPTKRDGTLIPIAEGLNPR